MSNIYENTIEEFNKRGYTLLTTKFFKITLKEKISEWILPYMFDYENIDRERLLALLM